MEAKQTGQGTPFPAIRPLAQRKRMKELLRTNNLVYLSFAQAVLKDAGIETLLFDSHMSVMDGSIGALPRRLMVDDDDLARAQKILAEAEPPQQDSTTE